MPLSRTVDILMIGMITLMLSACGGGTSVVPPTAPPVITAVTPTGAVGAAGTEVTFSATATGSPTEWEWDFGGGAFPLTSTEASPRVTLLREGSFAGTVTAANAIGVAAPFPFTYTVGKADPRVINVSPAKHVGAVGDTITLNALAAGDPDGWHWNLDDVGEVVGQSGSGITVRLNTPGPHTGTVRVASGEKESPEFSFEIWVTGVPRWQQSTIARFTQVGGVTAAVIGGKPCMALVAETGGSHKFLFGRGNSANPHTEGEWQFHEFATEPTAWYRPPVLMVFAGNPAVVFGSITGGVGNCFFALSRVPEPAGAADWDVSLIRSEASPGAATVFRGELVLLLANTRELLFAHAAPGGPDDWTMFQAPRLVTDRSEMVEVGDSLALAAEWINDTDFIFATSHDPRNAMSWTVHTPVGGERSGFLTSLTAVAGRPALAWEEFGPKLAVVAIGKAETPDRPEDWSLTEFTWSVFPGDFRTPDVVTEYRGRPLVVCSTSNFFWPGNFAVVPGWSPAPQHLGEWRIGSFTGPDATPQAAVTIGKRLLVISRQNEDTESLLRLASSNQVW